MSSSPCPIGCIRCDKQQCHAHRRNDPTVECRNRARLGLRVCRLHGGSTPQAQKKTERVAAELAGREKATRLALRLGVSIEIDPFEALMQAVNASAGMVACYQHLLANIDLNGPLTVGESALVGLYGDERDRLTRAAKAAVDAGIDERTVQIVEGQASAFADVIRSMLLRLGLPAAQQREGFEIASGLLREIGARSVSASR